MDRVVHFEIPVDDLDRAQEFYKGVFDWKMNSMPGAGYVLIGTTATDEKGMPKEPGAINGGMLKRTGPIKSPVITISVPNIDESLGTVKAHGGKVAMDKFKVGEIGLSAYVEDTEGNVIGLWQELR